jgi:acyl-CoA synthetase (AMP-forming)/AMP-acid ligase II
MFASPALLRNLGRWGQETGETLTSLRRVLSAGAPARRQTLEQVSEMLTGNAEVFTPYGATESLPVADIGSYEVLGETWPLTATGKGICVGRPVPGITARIIGITDEPIEDWSDDLLVEHGQVGEITVRGPQVTRRYYARAEQTALAKIRDGHEVVHRMGDVGYFDDKGRLWMCGRKSHRVETPEGPVFTVPVERIFDEHPAVRWSALVGVGLRGEQRALLLVEREAGFQRLSDADLLGQLREIRARHDRGPTSLLREIIIYPKPFPVDVRHNAKIGRERLTEWANARFGG